MKQKTTMRTLQELALDHLSLIQRLLPEHSLTLVARHPTDDEAHIVLTKDSVPQLRDVIDAAQRYEDRT